MDEYDAHVLILGGSFTGIELVRLLRRDRRGRALEIVVVDRQREHPYIPLGHELLTERLPFERPDETLLRSDRFVEAHPPARWVQGEIVGFDPGSHTVTLADGRSLSGRFVVVALGSEVRAPASLPGGERMLAYKFGAQLEQAHDALVQLLKGEREGEPTHSDPDPRSGPARRPEAEYGRSPGRVQTILVAGGGISGVEIAGELAHLAVARPHGWRAPKVVLVHGGDRLLPGLTAKAGHKAEAALREQGVDVHLQTRLLAVDERSATIQGPAGERTIACDLSFWAAGLQPPAVIDALELPRTEDGWLRVGPTLLCFSGNLDEPEIFAAGDIARVYGGAGRWPTMQRAIEGIFAAQTLAANILALGRHPPGYPDEGVPPLRPHRLWTDFPHGVSLGGRSLIVYGRLVVSWARFNVWFRRFLMRMYMRRYRA
ncbi:MAG TPA: FAD-dependent oxidoreductase [Enhygromyxa sp.]|nr:FAD-dependent oxidoreductase [Enhygromyxa sp.]